MTEPWKHPDLSNVWEVSEITDRTRFMRFVLERAPLGSTWIVTTIFKSETIQILSPLATTSIGERPSHFFGLIPGTHDDVRIVLTSDVKAQLLNHIDELDFSTEFIEQHVYEGDAEFLVSYDNLTCCWLTKRLTENELSEASDLCGFSFSESQAT